MLLNVKMATFIRAFCALFVALPICILCAKEHPLSNADLLQKIEVLESQGQRLERNMAEQARHHQVELSHQAEVIGSLQTMVTKQGINIKRLGAEVASFKDIVDNKSAEMVHAKYGYRNASAESATYPHNGRIAGRLVVNPEGPVAFHAEITKMSVTHIRVGQTIVYDSMLTNIGGAYSPNTGKFVAPINGIYIFSTSVMSHYKPHNEIWVTIKKNGQGLGGAFAYGDASRDQGSITAVAQLAVGDEVWVSLSGLNDDSLWGHGFTSFMGCLVMFL